MALSIILADNQVIFRTGMSRVLGVDSRFRLVAQCVSPDELHAALKTHSPCIVVYAAGFDPDIKALALAVNTAKCRGVVVLEHEQSYPAELTDMVHGTVSRSVAVEDFLACLQRVGAGKRSIERARSFEAVPHDFVGANLLVRLTRKELQIIALVSEGWKNREIAERLGTKEQVVKNYLCNIYDKTGVSDRLELALYTVHHPTLANAADQVRSLMAAEQMRSSAMATA